MINTFKRDMTNINYWRAKEQIAKIKRNINRAKRESWKSSCNPINNSTSTAKVWQTIKWFSRKKEIKFLPINYDGNLQYEFLKSMAPDTIILKKRRRVIIKRGNRSRQTSYFIGQNKM